MLPVENETKKFYERALIIPIFFFEALLIYYE